MNFRKSFIGVSEMCFQSRDKVAYYIFEHPSLKEKLINIAQAVINFGEHSLKREVMPKIFHGRLKIFLFSNNILT